MAIRLRDLVPADCGATPEQLRGHDCFTCRRKARISTGSRACGARSRAGYVHAPPAGSRSWARGSVPPSRRSRVKIAAGSSKTAETPPHEEGRCPCVPSRKCRWATGRGGGLAEVVVFSFCKRELVCVKYLPRVCCRRWSCRVRLRAERLLRRVRVIFRTMAWRRRAVCTDDGVESGEREV